jgi:hypothetical protein
MRTGLAVTTEKLNLEARAVDTDCSGNNTAFLTRIMTGQPDKNDTSMDAVLAENQFSKVFVGGEQDGAVFNGSSKHLGVLYRIADVANRFNDLPVHAFVGKEIHPVTSSRG